MTDTNDKNPLSTDARLDAILDAQVKMMGEITALKDTMQELLKEVSRIQVKTRPSLNDIRFGEREQSPVNLSGQEIVDNSVNVLSLTSKSLSAFTLKDLIDKLISSQEKLGLIWDFSMEFKLNERNQLILGFTDLGSGHTTCEFLAEKLYNTFKSFVSTIPAAAEVTENSVVYFKSLTSSNVFDIFTLSEFKDWVKAGSKFYLGKNAINESVAFYGNQQTHLYTPNSLHGLLVDMKKQPSEQMICDIEFEISPVHSSHQIVFGAGFVFKKPIEDRQITLSAFAEKIEARLAASKKSSLYKMDDIDYKLLFLLGSRQEDVVQCLNLDHFVSWVNQRAMQPNW